MVDSLSTFFIKVHYVEESFLKLSDSDKERALTILSSSIKKLQTLLGVTETSTVISDTHSMIITHQDTHVYNDDDDDDDNNNVDLKSNKNTYFKEKPINKTSIKRKICKRTLNKVNSKRQTRNLTTSDVILKEQNVSKISTPVPTKRSSRLRTKLAKKAILNEEDSKISPVKTFSRNSPTKEINNHNTHPKKLVTSKRRVFHCTECNENLTHPRSIKSHIQSHELQLMSCLKCRSELRNIHELHYHVCESKMVSNTKHKTRHSCAECGITFKLLKSLKRHLLKIHSSKFKKYKCSECEQEFTKKGSLHKHLETHVGDKMVCLVCGKLCDTFNSFADHMNSHDNEAEFQCDVCNDKFAKIQQYKQHMAGHEKYNCSQCVQSFSSNEKLEKHEQREHDMAKSRMTDRRHICDVCGKLFSTTSQLLVHQRLHTGEKPLECLLCNMSFRTRRALLKHKESYSHCVTAGLNKERHYLCSHCGKSFFRKQTLKRHLRCHTGERPHMCQYCGYKTSEINNLKRHVLHHFKGQRNYICEICGNGFHSKKTLESHLTHKHNEERNFACPECQMTFKSKSGLNRHMKTHSKTKEHKCWCDAAFGRLSNLRRHMKSVHGSDSALPPVRKIAVLDEIEQETEVDKTETLESEKYDQTQLSHGLHEQNMMASCLQMTETYQTHHPSMSSHMTLDTQGMVYDTMTSAQTLVGYPNTQPVGVDQRPTDYYHNNMNMMDNMATTQDYNNSCMYIQNVLLPSVAGLLDLSHAGK